MSKFPSAVADKIYQYLSPIMVSAELSLFNVVLENFGMGA